MVYDISIRYSSEFLREMSPEDLEVLLDSSQQRFFELRCQCSPSGRVKFVPKPHLFDKIKKDIARIKTLLKES